MLLCANAALEENKQRINELNVFPVPDGDTGTNMSLTMNSAAIELGRKQTDTVGAVADCAASALLRGARGNSGVILSLLFRGIAKSLKGRENANAAEFAAAVSAGVDAAYKAVMKPAEGTILTVSRLGAQAAVEFAKESTDFEAMLEALLAAAREALADTQNINPVLRRAGVVDAGGEGFVEMAAFDVFSLRQYLQERMASGRRGDAFEGRPDFRRRVFRGGDCKRTLRCGEYGRTQNGGEQKFRQVFHGSSSSMTSSPSPLRSGTSMIHSSFS